MNRRKTATYTYAAFNPPRPQILKIDRGFDKGSWCWHQVPPRVGLDTLCSKILALQVYAFERHPQNNGVMPKIMLVK